MKIVYEDNHLLAVDKESGEIAQGDCTGDETVIDKAKAYLRDKYSKPGNVYIGLPHRLDRPTSGLLLLAKTDKALSRLNNMFSTSQIYKAYLAVVDSPLPRDCGELENWLVKNEKENKSYIVTPAHSGAKLARLRYEKLGQSDNYFLYKIILETGRHHQIRAQLSGLGVHIKGDLKYGSKRSNPDGSISLHSYNMKFQHPVGGKMMDIKSLPSGGIWDVFDLGGIC